LARELSGALAGARIDKITQPEKDEIVLHVRTQDGNRRLLVSASPQYARMHFTEERRENPDTPPMFCMLLRKHISGARVLDVAQEPGDKILTLTLAATDELGDRSERRLVAELIRNRANVVLLDAEGRILGTMKRADGDLAAGQRSLLPGLFYQLPLKPPPRGTDAAPCAIAGNLSEAIETFYSKKAAEQLMRRRSAELQKTLSTLTGRVQRRVAAQEQELLAADERDVHRQRGDMITANLHLLSRGMPAARVPDYSAEPDGDGVYPERIIALDPQLTPSQNAARHYKLYAKAKNAVPALQARIASGRAEAEYLRSVQDAVHRADGERVLQDIRAELAAGGYMKATGSARKMKHKPVPPLRYVSPEGFTVAVGRNGRQNDSLVKAARPDDLWFHVQKQPGSHVVVDLSSAGGKAGTPTLEMAASLAAWHSAARESSKAAVDCCPVRRVKKPNGAAPGMVIYSGYETYRVEPKEYECK
jgi:predicted ribosome quality control (RQC) complex YloA/Tae2 family protein